MLVKKILVARMIAWALLVIFCLILGMTSVAGDITTTPVVRDTNVYISHAKGVPTPASTQPGAIMIPDVTHSSNSP
jgi:hypothetical protein